MRRRFSYANVVATLALVFAMSGGALAAGHYLINSTKQINPKVLRKLHGARGARGTLGPTGAIGPQGVEGPEGHKGGRGEKGEPGFSALSQLPSGKTESGELSLSAPASAIGEALATTITFSIPLTAPITEKVEFTKVGTPGTNCLGVGSAAKGYLCVYTSSEANVEAKSGAAFDPEAEATPGTGRFGAGLSFKAAAAGPVRVTGTYSVTAP
jgi:hypothetical protein